MGLNNTRRCGLFGQSLVVCLAIVDLKILKAVNYTHDGNTSSPVKIKPKVHSPQRRTVG